jgi:hypothetical protein
MMPRRGTLHPIIIRGHLIFSALLFSVLACSGASAQMGTIGATQSDLVKKPAAEQAAILAEVVRGAWKGQKCANAKVPGLGIRRARYV